MFVREARRRVLILFLTTFICLQKTVFAGFAGRFPIPRLILFDINGTLVKSQHNLENPGSHYLLEALSIIFKKPVKLPENWDKLSGGTDGSITTDLLKLNGITSHNTHFYKSKLYKALSLHKTLINGGVTDGRYHWKQLTNVNTLLTKLFERDDVRIGLLTGNQLKTANLKLTDAGVRKDVFQWGKTWQGLFGAFGWTDHSDRSELVKIARARYEVYNKGRTLNPNEVDIRPNDMVIVGDTPRDIKCAHDNGVPCVAVDTGHFSHNELTGADYLLKGGFRDVDESVRAILTTKRGS